MSDLISRQALMKEFSDFVRESNNSDFAQTPTWNDAVSLVGSMPSAEQQEQEIYSTMPDEDFEEWLRAHGICHPDIHEPIPCSAVPLLIDAAINELLSAQPEQVRTQMSSADCISRQAAIDAAIEAADDWDGGSSKERERFIREALQELPSAQPEQRWIPVTERLPEKDGRYLITGIRGTVYPLAYEDGRWYGGIRPVAWMSLPEPYQAERRTDETN